MPQSAQPSSARFRCYVCPCAQLYSRVSSRLFVRCPRARTCAHAVSRFCRLKIIASAAHVGRNCIPLARSRARVRVNNKKREMQRQKFPLLLFHYFRSCQRARSRTLRAEKSARVTFRRFFLCVRVCVAYAGISFRFKIYRAIRARARLPAPPPTAARFRNMTRVWCWRAADWRLCVWQPFNNQCSLCGLGSVFFGSTRRTYIVYKYLYGTYYLTPFLIVAAPNFVSSFTQGDFVYFFFRETAVEYINCGKVSSPPRRANFASYLLLCLLFMCGRCECGDGGCLGSLFVIKKYNVDSWAKIETFPYISLPHLSAKSLSKSVMCVCVCMRVHYASHVCVCVIHNLSSDPFSPYVFVGACVRACAGFSLRLENNGAATERRDDGKSAGKHAIFP